MSSTTTSAVTPRRNGEPEVDLSAYRLVHRAALTDVAALADLADRVAGGLEVLPPAKAAAVHRYAGRLCTEIAALQAAEDQDLWPVVSASAGSAVDLCELRADHRAAAALLARCRSSVAALAVAPDDRAVAVTLAGAATDLLGLLQEHVESAESELFPAIRRFVSVPDYRMAVARARRRTGSRRVGWVLAWLARHATAAEVEQALTGLGAGSRSRLLLALSGPLFARERRAALG